MGDVAIRKCTSSCNEVDSTRESIHGVVRRVKVEQCEYTCTYEDGSKKKCLMVYVCRLQDIFAL